MIMGRNIKLVVIDEGDQVETVLRNRFEKLRIESIQPTSLTSMVQDHYSFDDALFVILNHSSSSTEVETCIQNIRQIYPSIGFIVVTDERPIKPVPLGEAEQVCSLDQLIQIVERAMENVLSQETVSENEARIKELEAENLRLRREVDDLNAIGEVARSITVPC